MNNHHYEGCPIEVARRDWWLIHSPNWAFAVGGECAGLIATFSSSNSMLHISCLH